MNKWKPTIKKPNMIDYLMNDKDEAKYVLRMIHNITTLRMEDIKPILYSGKLDKEIFEELSKKVSKLKPMKNKSEFSYESRWKVIREQIKDLNVKSYLDFGGGDCEMAEFVCGKLSPSAKCYCADIEDWAEKTYYPDDKLSTKILINPVTNNVHYPSNSIEVITSIHVLHHIKDIYTSLSEIHRILKKSGLLIIREHDCPNMKKKYLIDIQHLIWGVVMGGSSYDDFIDNYYGKYRNRKKWIDKISSHGMKLILDTKTKGVGNNFYMVFMKE